MTAAPIVPVQAVSASGAVNLPLLQPTGAGAPSANSFSSLLIHGIDGVNTKALQADEMVRAFVLDDSIPVHQVTFALEQARLSLELMMQVRGRMVEAYQQFMNMQL